jgi:hypothetical protein
MERIRLDLNLAEFQDSWFGLDRAEFDRVAVSLRKIRRMTWTDLYRSPGFKWEAIESRSPAEASRLYTFRITQKSRAIAYREGAMLRMVSIHPDHDSAYR